MKVLYGVVQYVHARSTHLDMQFYSVEKTFMSGSCSFKLAKVSPLKVSLCNMVFCDLVIHILILLLLN